MQGKVNRYVEKTRLHMHGIQHDNKLRSKRATNGQAEQVTRPILQVYASSQLRQHNQRI